MRKMHLRASRFSNFSGAVRARLRRAWRDQPLRAKYLRLCMALHFRRSSCAPSLSTPYLMSDAGYYVWKQTYLNKNFPWKPPDCFAKTSRLKRSPFGHWNLTVPPLFLKFRRPSNYFHCQIRRNGVYEVIYFQDFLCKLLEHSNFVFRNTAL